MYVVGALFIALALDPVVRRLESLGLRRSFGITIVFGGFLLIVGGVLALVIPMVANQIMLLIRNAPSYFTNVTGQEWFLGLQERFGDYIDFDELLIIAQDFVGKPENWAQVAGGVWQAGLGIANGATAFIIVL